MRAVLPHNQHPQQAQMQASGWYSLQRRDSKHLRTVSALEGLLQKVNATR